LREVFDQPTRSTITFSAIETLVIALGGEVTEREGSRVILSLPGGMWHTHRPHPGKEAKKYQVEEFREFLRQKGFVP